MSAIFDRGPKKDSQDDLVHKSRQGISLAKTTTNIAKELQSGHPTAALHRAIIGGMKLAEEGTAFYNENAGILELAAELKKIGLHTLAWEPETLFAEIDRRYRNWTPERVAKATEHFHTVGLLDTDVPLLVRNKIHAIRLVATTDSPHTEWNIFEKVGGAFNDRVPNFGLIEPLSAAECARTVILMENIRPDSYTNEIKIYIAGCCQTDGLYTVEPIRALTMAEPFLRNMVEEETNEKTDLLLKKQILDKFQELAVHAPTLREIDAEDVASVQATRLFAIRHYAEESSV